MIELVNLWKGWTWEEKQNILRFCRIVKLYDTSKKKIVMSWSPTSKAQELRQTFCAAVASIPEIEYKIGRPPAGHMERELSLWLKEIGKA